MAETYGTETHEHEDEYGEEHQNDDAASEAPSDYEFADESGATADVEHNEEILSSEEKSPRRSPVLPLVAVVGGILLLGSVAWWQFGSHSSTPAPFPGSIPVPIAALPTPAVAPHSAVTQMAKTGAPVPTSPPAPAVLPVTPRVASTTPQMEITDQSSALALPSSGTTPNQGIAPLSATVPPLPVIPPPSPSAASAVPAAPAAATPTAALSPPLPVAAPPSPMAMTIPVVTPPAALAPPAPAVLAAPGAADKAQIDALNAHVNDLQNKLDHVDQQLNQVMNMVVATDNAQKQPSEAVSPHNMASRPSSSPQNTAIMAEAKQQPAAPTDAPAPQVTTSSQNDIDMEKPPVHHASKHKKTHQSVVHKAAPQDETVAQPQETRHAWVLRAATPGHAWLAASLDSHDLKEVHVGDKIAGIGQVTSIHPQGNSWVVQGTRGTIR